MRTQLKRMQAFISMYSLYPLMLPLFFFLRGWKDAYGAVDRTDVLLVTGIYLLITIAIMALFRLLLGSGYRAALAATAAMALLLYWGNGVYGLQAAFSGTFLTRLVPAVLILLAAAGGLVVLLSRLRESVQARVTLFFNLVLICWTITEGVGLVLAMTAFPGRPAAFRQALPPAGKNLPGWKVYFLLFDEYAGSNSLRRDWGFDNSAMDSFLQQEGFSVQHNARSNYNYTHFSMASMLNADYLRPYPDSGKVVMADYRSMLGDIANARVIQSFINAGYDFHNLSIFRIADQPALLGNSGVAEGMNMITSGTFYAVFCRDYVPRLKKERIWPQEEKEREAFFMNDTYNKGNLASLGALIDSAGPQQRFIYTHFVLPHFPIYYDSAGNRLSDTEAQERSRLQSPADYALNVRRANGIIRSLVTRIKQKDSSRAVIVISGDHGFRRKRAGDADDRPLFSIQHAVYFPDHNYAGLYDSISAVNTFRVIMNRMLGTGLEMLPDVSIRLDDEQKD